jgi:Na+-transporting NADH:ubiquinone oxidoreductase subunit NqrC
MNLWAFISLILLILVAALYYLLNKKTREKELLEKQDRRNWTLKVALEKTFKLPTVEAKELEVIEPQINQMMNESIPDAELEEKMRVTIMELYAQKAERRVREAPKKDAAPQKYPPISGKGR